MTKNAHNGWWSIGLSLSTIAGIGCTKAATDRLDLVAKDAAPIHSTPVTPTPNPSASAAPRDKECDPRRVISAQEAVQIAEQFVVLNGFTEIDAGPLDPDTAYVNPMLRSFGRELQAKDMAMRRGYVLPRATGVEHLREGDWMVIFPLNVGNTEQRRLYADVYPPDARFPMEKAGALVGMDAHGCNLRMGHEALLSAFKLP